MAPRVGHCIRYTFACQRDTRTWMAKVAVASACCQLLLLAGVIAFSTFSSARRSPSLMGPRHHVSQIVRRAEDSGLAAETAELGMTTTQAAEGKDMTGMSTPQEQTKQRLHARESLLAAIAPLNRGFEATEEQRIRVNQCISMLAPLNPTKNPTASLCGEWTLMYTDAPDIIGIPEGPFAQLDRIGQEIDAVAGTIANVIEYKPSPLAAGFLSMIQRDKLVQRVYTKYEATSPTEVELKIQGLSFQPQRVLGLDLPDMFRLEARGPLTLPFGRFEILYLDEDIRIVRTGQGWVSINSRVLQLDESV